MYTVSFLEIINSGAKVYHYWFKYKNKTEHKYVKTRFKTESFMML